MTIFSLTIAKKPQRDARHGCVGPALLLLLATVLVIGSPAFAGSTVGSFEIDGNTVDFPPGEPIDWQTSPFPAGLTKFTDATGQADDSFGQGSKELEPSTWRCLDGAVPGKDDILSGAVAFRTINGKQFLYVNWLRAGVNGDAHVDYEFNRSILLNPVCPETPQRSNGDFVITFDTENGGKRIFVRAFVWVGDASSGTFQELALGSQGVIWDGAVNIPNTIPGLQPGAFGEAVLNLTDSPLGALGCNEPISVYMKTRASTAITAELKDRTRALPVNFSIPRPENANASGSAFAANVVATPLGIDLTLPDPSPATSQHGVGSTTSGNQVLNVAVPPPPPGTILDADVLSAQSTSAVTAAPPSATQASVSETSNVNVLNGLVTADFVRGVATAEASGFGSSFSSAGSTFENLVVNGQPINDVTPGTRIDLPATAFGVGSFVMLYERVGSTSGPPPGVTSGGTYAADLEVNMIRVHVTVLGADVTVSNAVAHADFPQVELCPAAPGSVSGNATVVNEQADPSLVPVVFGIVSIPPSGGRDHQDLDELTTDAVSGGTAVSESAGTVGSTSSNASSFAQVQNVCVLGTTVCADVVKSQANSAAGAGVASSTDSGTTLIGISVMGSAPIGGTPPPNTTIELPGIGFVTLNEQFCDGSSSLPDCGGTAHSGVTVRAIHVVVTNPNAFGVPLGTDVIVAEAHADATFPQ
jgi:hypothetical protein